MSIQAVSWVLEQSPAEHGDRLVLISLANHAHPDGTHSFPTVPTLAHEARLGRSDDPRSGRRAVQYALRSLAAGYEGSGVAIVEAGVGPNGATMWTILMDGQARTFRSTPRRILVAGGANSAPPGGRINAPRRGAINGQKGRKKASRVLKPSQPSGQPAPLPPAARGNGHQQSPSGPHNGQLQLGPTLTLVPASGRARDRQHAAAARAAELASYVTEHPARTPTGALAEVLARMSSSGRVGAAATLALVHVHHDSDAGIVLGVAQPPLAGIISATYAPALQKALGVHVRVLDCGCTAVADAQAS